MEKSDTEIGKINEELLMVRDKVQLIINKTEKPNSREFGKAGDRFKLYFEDAEDLAKQIKDLKEKGLWKDE